MGNVFFDHYAKQHRIVRVANWSIREEPDQSACFALGAVALGGAPSDSIERTIFYRNLRLIANTCLSDFLAMKEGDTRMLRPRLAESLFVLWRQTGDTTYRRMGLQMCERIESWRVSGGFTFPGTTVQPAFLLGETFKYLYLLFAPRSVLALGDFVFNTAGHPYPINKAKPADVQEITVVHFGNYTPRRRVRILQAQIMFPE
jgi:mannosyl-oligosaccharide alpha-1,2-mannosidase